MNQETLKTTLEHLRNKWMEQHNHISEQSALRVINVLGRAEEFEEKFAAIRKHTAESLTLFANEWIEDIHAYLIQRNGVYHGEIVLPSPTDVLLQN